MHPCRIACLFLLLPSAALADDAVPTLRRVALTVGGPTEPCPTASEELGAAIDTRLDRAVVGAEGEPEATLEIVTTPRREGHFEVALHFAWPGHTLDATRLLDVTADRCADVVDTVALVAAMMIESMRAEARLRVPERSAPPREPPHALVPSPAHSAREREPSALPARAALPALSLDVGAAIGVGYFADVAPGVSAGVRVAPGAGRYAFEGTVLVLPYGATENQEGRGARFFALLGSAAFCGRPLDAHRIALDACGGVEAGVTHADPVGLAVPNDADALLVDPFVGLRLDLTPGAGIVVRGRATLAVPITRPAYHYEGASGERVLVHEIPPVLGRFELSIGLALGGS